LSLKYSPALCGCGHNDVTNIYLQFIVAGLTAYLIGSFPTGVIMTKLLGGPDVRYHGSGNTGGTNTMRLVGVWAGVTVVVIDALKGLFAWGVAYLIMLGSPWALPWAGTLAVMGHCWPIYTKFKGGMGLATGGALILVSSPWTIAIAIPVWAIFYGVVFKKQYSPRCVTITMPMATVLSIIFLPLTINVQLLVVLLTIVLVIRHLPEWNRVQ
jgi:acyl phosphate:glycerol-3-phosphate acyltransferase